MVVTPKCSIAPEDCSGWFRSPVSLTWTVQPEGATKVDCPDREFTDDTPPTGIVAICSASEGTAEPVTEQVTIKLDKTPPAVTGSPSRASDHAGWFTAPIRFDVRGADATSGPAAFDCPPVTYDGPDGAAATIVGTCTDTAGNVGSAAFLLNFDATPPPLVGLKATPGDRRVAVRWEPAADAASVEVVRVPGVGLEPASVVFTGPGAGFEDKRVQNGVRYVYRVRLSDLAGHEASGAVAAVPTSPAPDPVAGAAPLSGPSPSPAPRRRVRLLLPIADATVNARRPPLLRWTPVRRASYYNVQLYRRGRKILSSWPARPRYQLKRRWTFGGKVRRLAPGRYRWYVWPGFGRRAQGRYGDVVGRRAFRVVVR